MGQLKHTSVYIKLGVIIILVIASVVSLHSTVTYLQKKKEIVQQMKERSNNTIIAIKNNITNLIASYSINEYNNLILNEIQQRDILGIVIEDYNMGKIVGSNVYVTGKLKIEQNQIIDYNEKDSTHKLLLTQAYYIDAHHITLNDEIIGTITIYISDETIQKAFAKSIKHGAIEAMVLALLLTLFLFITIRYFILKPISKIVEQITQQNSDGIPLKSIKLDNQTKEIAILSSTMNHMLDNIKRSREILEQNQQSLRDLLELSPIAIRIAKNEGKDIIFANNAYYKLIQKQRGTPLHHPKNYYTHEEHYDNIMKELQNNKRIYNQLIELSIHGKQAWVLGSYMNFEYENCPTVIGWFYDITEKILTQKDIEQQKNEFEAIFKYSLDGLAIIDLNSQFLDFNDAYLQLTGFSKSELLQKSCIELSTKEDKEEAIAVINEVIEKGYYVNFEKNCVVKDEKVITVTMSLVLLPDKQRILITTKDITQSKLLESQAKLASMGEMIGNIAHQWRQPLSIISTLASGIKVKSEFEQLKINEILPDMDNILKQTNYLSKTIDDFRDYIKTNNKKEDLNLLNVLKKTISLVQASLKNNNIQMVVELEDDLEIHGFENQLIQAFINIINNAKDAIKEHVQNDADKFIFIRTKMMNDKFIITIKDSGGGIPKNILDKIFEPYFTTKHKSMGTGIGLSMAHQIITEHHNAKVEAVNETFTYQNKSYTGACFFIIFKA
jgi:PAS domain S-box-containing protein